MKMEDARIATLITAAIATELYARDKNILEALKVEARALHRELEALRAATEQSTIDQRKALDAVSPWLKSISKNLNSLLNVFRRAVTTLKEEKSDD